MTERTKELLSRLWSGCLLVVAALLFAGAMALVAYGAQPALAEPVHETIDLLEINHHYDSSGKINFAQLIAWTWNSEWSEYDCISFRIVKSGDYWPQRDHKQGGYYVLWQDGEILRRVKSHAFRETWTQEGVGNGDPEIFDRMITRKEDRREFRNPVVRRVKPPPIGFKPVETPEVGTPPEGP